MVRQLESAQRQGLDLAPRAQQFHRLLQHRRVRVTAQQHRLAAKFGQHRNAAAVGCGAVRIEGLRRQFGHVFRSRRHMAQEAAPGFDFARRAACGRDLFGPAAGQRRQPFWRGRQQRERQAAGQHKFGQFVGLAHDGVAFVHELVPGQLLVLDQRREGFALLGVQEVGQVAPAVEPEVVKSQAQRAHVFEQLDGATDVVVVDVRQDEEFEVPLGWRQRFDLLAQQRVGAGRSAVHQHPRGLGAATAVLDPQRVAMARGQHLDIQERLARVGFG